MTGDLEDEEGMDQTATRGGSGSFLIQIQGGRNTVVTGGDIQLVSYHPRVFSSVLSSKSLYCVGTLTLEDHLQEGLI